MNRLLSANFMRVKKNKCFWICSALMFVMGIYFAAGSYADMKKMGWNYTLDGNCFVYILFAPVLLAVFGSLFLGTEYSDGTIRNKVMVGHRRLHIYLSNLLTMLAVGIAFCALYLLPYLAVGIPLLGSFEADIRKILLIMAVTLVLICAYGAIYTMIAMLSSNKAGVTAGCILAAFVLLFSGVYISSRLEEPEFYTDYNYTVGGKIEDTGVKIKNPRYVDGKKREVYQFVYDFLPGGQEVQCVRKTLAHPFALPVYSGAILVLTTAGGIWLFRRKDIK
ncbi:MAG: ABC transporter permease subunit [Blautia sp.]|nr:ABC transporter permease subunit [Blautia sp.]